MSNTVRKSIQTVITLAVMLLLSYAANAGETRFFKAMPSGKSLSGIEGRQSKKPIWDCGAVKTNDKGNFGAVASAKHKLLASVGESETAAEEANKAVRCTLKIWSKEKKKMTNANLGDGDDA